MFMLYFTETEEIKTDETLIIIIENLKKIFLS